MAEIWLWNSITTRKRAPSDGFLENGLAILKGSCEENGHRVKVIDWQKDSFYKKLCPSWLALINRISAKTIISLGGKRRLYAKLYFPIYNFLQESVNFVRNHRIKRYLEKFGDEIIRKKIKIFGIKVWYGEAFIWSEYLANYIKEKDPSMILIAGGFHVTLYREELMKNSSFDLGVFAEGEKSLNIILDIVEKNSKDWKKDKILEEIFAGIKRKELKNVVYRDGGKIKTSGRYPISLDNKSLPKYSKEDIEEKIKIHVLLDSLGCPWGKCNFCVHNHFYPGFHTRKIKSIISEIEYMISQGVTLFRFAGSETPPTYGAKIAKAILKKNLNIRYTTGCRAISGIASSKKLYDDTVKKFEIMLKSGLRAIFVGGECANDIINEKIMNKGVKKEDLIRTAQAYHEAQKNTSIKAYLTLALIYPTPTIDGIDLKTIFKENIKLIKNSKPDSVIVSPPTPFKNTQWYNEKEKFGFSLDEDFIKKMMSYEYVLYKPPTLWPKLENVKLGNLNFIEILNECERLRKKIEDMGIPSDLTDELFLMLESSGYTGKNGLKQFKEDTTIDLISSDYRNIKRINKKTNEFNRKLLNSNMNFKS